MQVTTIAWNDYRQTRSIERRNAIVEHYLPWTYRLAASRKAKLPEHIELADVQSLAHEALIWSVERFEPERGVPFEAWAGRRIIGAIADGMRQEDWVPRLVRSRARADGTEDELGAMCQYSGVDSAETRPDSLHPADPHPSGADLVEARDFKRHVYRGLRYEQQLVLMLYFGEGMTLREVARVIGLNESRASQILTAVKAILRARFGVRLPSQVHSCKGHCASREYRNSWRRDNRRARIKQQAQP